ncbi:MAG: glycosyltransferase family 2 protein [Actinobacteria bacterium]|nr:glycosyltransferase family 2 protein [Actinomycetota bacterium]
MSSDPAADAPSPRVAVVIVTHNTRADVLGCLDSLPAAGAHEVVVVDAGSTDGTVAAVRSAFPDVDVLALPNVGYGKGANAGVDRTSAPFVVVANADTRFAPRSLVQLAGVLADEPDVAAVGPLVRYPDGRHQASARRFPTLGQAAGHALLGLWWPRNPWTRSYRMLDEDPLAPRDVDWVSGCAVALRRDAFLDVGGFDPGYFMFVEDVDLGYRLRQAGWRVRFEPTAQVVHAVGASTGGARAAMVVAHARSLDRFYGRAYARGPGRLLRPFVRLGLALWVGLVLAWNRIVAVRSGRSTTGE